MNQKHKVSLVQVNFQVGPVELNSFHLPYTVGCVWAYAQAQPDIDSCYELNQLIWRRDPLEQVVDQLKNDAVVGFSTYVWNLQYNLHLAQALKAANPNCLIIFGGPEPAVSDPEIFRKYPWIDVIIKNEGEITFAEILRNRDCFAAVPGILINRDLQALDTGQAQRVDDLSILPSPYLSGLFDSLVANNADVKWSATLETNRGCPYQCTFCDWGSLTLSKIKKFTIERVYGELEWMSRNQIDFVTIADANFGIFPDRDRKIAEKFIEFQHQYGAPSGVATSFAKNQNKEVIDIVELLTKKTLNPTTGLKISLQSLTDDTLDAIKRKNLKINNISEILKIGREKDVPIGTELIMGLPRETLDTWVANIWQLLELGMHDDIDIYYCQVLENAELNQVQRDVYNIKTTKIYDYFSPTSEENVGCTAESIEVVTATESMSHADILQASAFNWEIFTWHVGGYSNLVSRFITRHCGISFKEFYKELFELAHQHTWYQDLRHQQIEILEDWFTHGRCTIDSGIPGIKLYGNSILFHTRMLLSLHPEIVKKWYSLLDQYLQKFNLDLALHQDLVDLQQNFLVPLQQRNCYPVTRTYRHNLWQYFSLDAELAATPTKLQFNFPEPSMSNIEFVERIYWSRRRRFGQATISQLS
jgi:putative methyltransferase